MLNLKNPSVIVVGFGKQGSFHTQEMKKAGTNIVGIVSHSKAGCFQKTPFYQTIKKAVKERRAAWAILFVPAQFTKTTALEALNCGLNLVLIAEGVPVHDTLAILQMAKEKNLIVVGPNCPGLIIPGQFKLGIMPTHVFQSGSTAIVSRSGTLAYEIAHQLTQNEIGQSIMIGIGGDPLIGFDFRDALKYLENDPSTKNIVLIGEIGGNLEELAAEFIKKRKISKKTVAYIAGQTAPKEKKMGHAGAIIEGESGTAASKMKAFQKAGVKTAKLPSEIIKFLKE